MQHPDLVKDTIHDAILEANPLIDRDERVRITKATVKDVIYNIKTILEEDLPWDEKQWDDVVKTLNAINY